MEPASVAAISTTDKRPSSDVSGALPATVQLVLDNARVDSLDATFEALVAVLRGPSFQPVFKLADTAGLELAPLLLNPVGASPDDAAVADGAPALALPVRRADRSPIHSADRASSKPPVARSRNERRSSRPRSMSVHVFAPMAVIVTGLAVVMLVVG